MITTIEIVGMILLAIFLGIAVWWFIIAENYRKYLDAYSYSRGAHATKVNQTLNLTCDSDKEICVFRATQICTDPSASNYENSVTDPISSGLSSDTKYGQFDSNTTVDTTNDLGDKCNGATTCAYKFTQAAWPSGMPSCGGETQLIAGYTCIPKDGKCQSYSGST